MRSLGGLLALAVKHFNIWKLACVTAPGSCDCLADLLWLSRSVVAHVVVLTDGLTQTGYYNDSPSICSAYGFCELPFSPAIFMSFATWVLN